jgi:hypothetical protein
VRRIRPTNAIDDGKRTGWLIYASPRHPKDTER